MLPLHDPSSFRALICRCWSDCKYILPWRTAWLREVRWLRTSVNSKMDTWWHWYRFWHFDLISWILYCRNEIVTIFKPISIQNNTITCVEIVVYDLGVSKHLGPKKLRNKNRQNSQRFLNYIKSSYIKFCPKLFWYTQNIYITHKKLLKYFWPKKSCKKIDKIYKDGELYQVFIA